MTPESAAPIKKAAAKYPNVKVVVDEPANFDPRIALKKIQDALLGSSRFVHYYPNG